ncbi:SusD family protein [Pedobacter sp. ok626]|uniref:RagB/SusD family nutrient uptake outer membrane protein n=1 Tax=Pedobacter sp. ok626 TaxID=1761882 RepID=UPI00088B5DDF|nr:RagB/SusD family nutrient uptake outer membrane protein [Pedobacter sp. ok626]SDJ34818.1 SusD family protein [Pedobacter sp. ok626]
MKNCLYLLMLLTLFASCKKFLDVQPESDVDKDLLFQSEDGYKEALNGVYTLCASRSLYGGNLTFSNLDIMAQNYEFAEIRFQKVASFDYTYAELRNKNIEIWASAYRAIANCNYILENIDNRKTLFSGKNYEIVKGETLTLRAYLHFDLLRMFAPSFRSNPTAKGIPYVTTVGTSSTPFSTVSEALDKMAEDLNAAKVLMKTTDPIVSSDYIVGYPGDDNKPEVNGASLFLQNRRHRMNYYAACAELARVYLYKNELLKSQENAQIVIASNKFPWTAQNDATNADKEKRDKIFYKELISSWFVDTKDINSQVAKLFNGVNPDYSATQAQIDDIFEKAQSGADDWRYRFGFLKVTSATNPDRALLQKYVKNAEPLLNKHPLVAPAIRLSEMYYIAAEVSYDTDPQKAFDYYNSVRINRGIGTRLTAVASKAEFIDILLKEARKEFYGESQIFYMYKRLNHAIKVSSTQEISPSDRIFVFPLPDDEQQYRNN